MKLQRKYIRLEGKGEDNFVAIFAMFVNQTLDYKIYIQNLSKNDKKEQIKNFTFLLSTGINLPNEWIFVIMIETEQKAKLFAKGYGLNAQIQRRNGVYYGF